MHDGCHHSRSTPFAGGSELEHTRGVSLTHGNMFSGGFIYNKANFCLMRQKEMQQKAVWMNFGLKGTKAEGPRPQSLAYPTLQLVQPLLSFSSQGPSLGSLATFWALGTSLNRNLLLQNESSMSRGRRKGEFQSWAPNNSNPIFSL